MGWHKSQVLAQECHKYTIKRICTTTLEEERAVHGCHPVPIPTPSSTQAKWAELSQRVGQLGRAVGGSERCKNPALGLTP